MYIACIERAIVVVSKSHNTTIYDSRAFVAYLQSPTQSKGKAYEKLHCHAVPAEAVEVLQVLHEREAIEPSRGKTRVGQEKRHERK